MRIGWCGILAWSAVGFLFFHNQLLTGRLPLFRDGANLFYPLWLYVREQYYQGRWPFWNSYLSLGMPLAAEGVAAVFYPGMLVFLIPIPYRWAYLLFLLSHLALAGWGTYRLARTLGVSRTSGFLASLTYPFSGYVLFQIYNPIYLISGAWLPFLLTCLWRLLRCAPQDATADPGRGVSSGWWRRLRDFGRLEKGSAWDILGCGVFLALMILGGDPQTAYHCLLIGGLIVIGRLIWIFRRHSLLEWAGFHSAWFFTGRNLAKLGLASFIAFALAAIQIIPTASYVPLTDRYFLTTAGWEPQQFEAIRTRSSFSAFSRNKAFSAESRPWWNNVAELEKNRYRRTVYDFSSPVYRWLELFWPNFGGRPLPYHTRWLAVFVEEGRWWVPSLYMGFWTAGLALSAVKFWPNRRVDLAGQGADVPGPHPGRDRGAPSYAQIGSGQNLPALRPSEGPRVMLTWIALLGGLAALGWYGPAGTITEIAKRFAGGEWSHTTPSAPVGGLYWLFVELLPQYRLFRYPSKWLIFTTLALACLAGIGLDRVLRANDPKANQVIRWLLRAMVAIALLCLFFAAFLVAENELWRQLPPDPLFGPFQRDFAIREFLTGGITLGGLTLASWVAVRWIPRDHRWAAIVAVTAADLLVHNSWMVFSVQPPTEGPGIRAGQPPQRHWTTWCDYPEEWERASSPHRVQEICDWEYRRSLFRWPMLSGRLPLENYGTLMPAEQSVLLGLLRDWLGRHNQKQPPAEWLHLFGIATGSDAEPAVWTSGNWPPFPPYVSECPQKLPLVVFVTYQWKEIPGSGGHRGDLWRTLAEIFFPSGTPRSWQEPVVVEHSGRNRAAWLIASPSTEPSERGTAVPTEACTLEDYRPGELVLRVQLTQPAVVVFREQHLPGWRVTVFSPTGEVRFKGEPLRIDGLFLGVGLPPGNWKVHFQYRPPGWPTGACVSAATWATILLGALLSRLSRARDHEKCESKNGA